ncbi:unnamed protein product, partial [Amoebophrya sp. A25]
LTRTRRLCGVFVAWCSDVLNKVDILQPATSLPESVQFHRRVPTFGLALGIVHAVAQFPIGKLLFLFGDEAQLSQASAQFSSARFTQELSRRMLSNVPDRDVVVGGDVGATKSSVDSTLTKKVDASATTTSSDSTTTPISSKQAALMYQFWSEMVWDFTPTPYSLGHGFGSIALFVLLLNVKQRRTECTA